MTTKPLVTKGMLTRAFASPARLVAGVLLVLTLFTPRLQAFSLIGPFADWMTPSLNYQYPYDIGGPMDVNEEYRWNVPVLTYAFDPSFLDYFGSNGVAAVEQAFQMLNELPPASSVVLTNYPTDSTRLNVQAASQSLYDLKSATLAALLEQLGLAEPTRHIYVLRQWDPRFLDSPGPWFDPGFWWEGFDLGYVIQRNFDPDTLLPTPNLNNILYTTYITAYGSLNPNPIKAFMVNLPVNPSVFGSITVADWKSADFVGKIFVGLTQDDVGGLRYLLSTNNINLEKLLPDVHGANTNADAYVDLALRPGVEKITFRCQDYDALLGQAIPTTYQFTDTYLTNGVVMHQQLERVVTQPDFLFCAGDTGEGNDRTPSYVSSGTTNWWNSSKVNGQTNNGPGVIRPPVRITYHKPGVEVYSDAVPPYAPWWKVAGRWWGSFDNSTNAPVAYPCGAAQERDSLTMRLRLYTDLNVPIQAAQRTWEIPVKTGGKVVVQASTNLVDWISYGVVTNQGRLVEWQHLFSPSDPQRFFRVVPQ